MESGIFKYTVLLGNYSYKPRKAGREGAVQHLNSDEECFASVSSGLGWTAFLLFAKAEPVKN